VRIKIPTMCSCAYTDKVFRLLSEKVGEEDIQAARGPAVGMGSEACISWPRKINDARTWSTVMTCLYTPSFPEGKAASISAGVHRPSFELSASNANLAQIN